MLQSLYTKECAFAFAAGITIIDKESVKEFGYIVPIKVVHHSVAKLAGKNFPLYRVFYHKADRGRWAIFARAQIVVEMNQISFKV